MSLMQNAPVAQLDRVPDYESGGYKFESCRVYNTEASQSQPVGLFLYHLFQPLLLLFPMSPKSGVDLGFNVRNITSFTLPYFLIVIRNVEPSIGFLEYV